uniref:3-ketosteroid-9-alpha-monooxygenase oxygenase component-like C-terminal domain-containing protein n=1 Tax=Glossina austeni TaxID=7395 RepID=A0A1A9VEM1_GLOAU
MISDPEEKPWCLPVIKEIENEEFVCHGRSELLVNCHFQEISENGADFSHFKAIHESSALAGATNPITSRWKNIGNHRCCLSILEVDAIGEQIGPRYVQIHVNSATFGEIKILQTVKPVEPLVQKVIHLNAKSDN